MPESLSARAVETALREKINPEKAEFLPKFFKTGKGEYAEGDKILGVVVPDQRAISKKFKKLPQKETVKLLKSPYHECRLTALFILVHQFNSGDETERQRVVDVYLDNLEAVNNWDLVDDSSRKILGTFLLDKPRTLLYEFAETDHLWLQRIAIISTYTFIKKGEFEDTLQLADILIENDQDLIHKAVGWMLREVGNKDKSLLVKFLKPRYKTMPRTMLRYAIEKFPTSERKKWLADEI